MSGVAICLHCLRARIVDVDPDPVCPGCASKGHCNPVWACDVCEQERVMRRMRIDALLATAPTRCIECDLIDERTMRAWGAD